MNIMNLRHEVRIGLRETSSSMKVVAGIKRPYLSASRDMPPKSVLEASRWKLLSLIASQSRIRQHN